MTRRRIPVLAVCGTDAAGRAAFFSRFYNAKQPLRVYFQAADAAPGNQPGVCPIQPFGATPDTPYVYSY